MLHCENLVKKYRGQNAVDGLNLDIKPGQIYALLGPNGSGKSTFMKIVAGLIKPTSGLITFKGKKIGQESKAAVAYMPTEPYFYSYMTWKNAEKFYSDFYSDFRPEVFERLLEEYGLRPDMKIAKMSSGMTAKGKLALVMARDAELVMLDEPLNGIDIIARDQILETIRSNHTSGKTFLISSHLVDELEKMTDWAIFMKNGRIELSGEAEQLMAEKGKTLTELYREIYQNCEC